MPIAKRLSACALTASALVLLALPALASANPGNGPDLVQRSGRLVFLHQDRADGSSSQQWMLASGTSHLPVRAPAGVWIDPGAPVRLQGTMQDGTLVLASSQTAVQPTGPSPAQMEAAGTNAASAATPVMHTTAVILFGFAGGPRQNRLPVSNASAAVTMFATPSSSPSSLNSYYQEQTYGQIGFSGQVYGPYDIAGPVGTCSNQDIGNWAAQAEAAAGIGDSAYQHYVFVMPGVPACNWLGLADVGGSHVWMNGDFEVAVLAHELGHNLGLAHAGGLKCTNAGVASPMGDACDPAGYEYMDPYDAMGQSFNGSGTVLRQMSMEHKLALGLLPPSAVQVVATSGTFRLTPMETLTGAIQLLRLPKPGGGSYFVEYRQPIGYFDSRSPSFAGVYIRTESPEVASEPADPNADTALIDMHPATGPSNAPWADARMSIGQVFSDPLNGVVIQDLGEDASGATIAVNMPIDTRPPSAPGGLTATPSGTSVSLAWTPAGDDFEIASYRVARDGVQIATPLTPGFVDAGLTPGTTLTYAVTAVDGAGNAGQPATVSVTLLDTSRPSPPPGVTARVAKDGRVHITWKASADNGRVASYRVLRAGKRLRQANVRSYVDKSPKPGHRSTVKYSVVAVDLAGNASRPGTAKPVRSALLRKLRASHVKVTLARDGGRPSVLVRGVVSDARALCRARVATGAWHPCRVRPDGAFSVNVPERGARRVALSLRDQLGRMQRQTVRVP
jgi:hypothetical protein